MDRLSGFICGTCLGRIEAVGGRRLIFRQRPGLSQVLYLYSYESWNGIEMGNVIRTLKYSGYQSIAGDLASLCARVMVDYPFYCEADAIAPIPLHPVRQRERGFNQAALMAEKISRELNLPFINPLRRRKNTAPQVELSTTDRELNVKGIFSVKRGISLKGMTVILFDDQVTTGATMENAALAMIEAGAELVLGLSITH